MALLQETLGALLQAWRFRLLNRSGVPLAQPVAKIDPPDDIEAKNIARFVDRVTNIVIFWKRYRCFYRSIAIASLLRRRGIPLVVNFGYRNLFDREKRLRAHCWLTLYDEMFEENSETAEVYTILLADQEESYRFWVGEEPNQNSI